MKAFAFLSSKYVRMPFRVLSEFLIVMQQTEQNKMTRKGGNEWEGPWKESLPTPVTPPHLTNSVVFYIKRTWWNRLLLPSKLWPLELFFLSLQYIKSHVQNCSQIPGTFPVESEKTFGGLEGCRGIDFVGKQPRSPWDGP